MFSIELKLHTVVHMHTTENLNEYPAHTCINRLRFIKMALRSATASDPGVSGDAGAQNSGLPEQVETRTFAELCLLRGIIRCSWSEEAKASLILRHLGISQPVSNTMSDVW